MKKIILFLAILFPITLCASSLDSVVDSLLNDSQGTASFSIWNQNGAEVISRNSTNRCAMQSVFKMPIAVAVLREVDQKQIALNDTFTIDRSQWSEKTWSPMFKEYKENRFNISVHDLLFYMLALSDNNACDILIQHLGGIKNVSRMCKNVGIKKISLTQTEQQQHQNLMAQYKNWITPNSACELLKTIDQSDLLSSSSKEILYSIASAKTYVKSYIAEGLPKESFVANKTGSSDIVDGILIVFNDIAIVQLPNGNRYYVAIFINNSKRDKSYNGKLISNIAHLVTLL